MTLQDEIRRRRELGMPPLTAEEQRQFQQNLTDTAGRDLREAGRGTVKSTMKGTKVLDGPYKGLTRPQMEQAIITGAAPPGKYAPGRMGTVRGSITGDSMYSPPAPSIAPPAPSAAPAPAAQTPPSAPSAAPAPVSAAQSLLTIPPLGAKPPLAPAPAPAPTAAPRAPGMINGQSAPQFFQETANRQKMPNSYGTIKPQSAAPAPAPSPPRAPAVPSATPPAGGQTMMAAAKPAPPAPGTSANEWTSPELGPPKAQRMDGINAGPPVALRMPGAMPDVMNPNWRRAQIAAAQPANAAPLPPYSETLASLAAPKPAPAAPATGDLTKPPMAAPPATAAPSTGGLAASQMGAFATSVKQIGGALNASNPNAWINDPLGMKKAKPVAASSTPTSRPAKTLQPPQLVGN